MESKGNLREKRGGGGNEGKEKEVKRKRKAREGRSNGHLNPTRFF